MARKDASVPPIGWLLPVSHDTETNVPSLVAASSPSDGPGNCSAGR